MDDASAGGLVSMDSGDADVDRDFAREEEVTEYVAPVARYSEEFAAMQLELERAAARAKTTVTQIVEQLHASAPPEAEWIEYFTEGGRPYYYNEASPRRASSAGPTRPSSRRASRSGASRSSRRSGASGRGWRARPRSARSASGQVGSPASDAPRVYSPALNLSIPGKKRLIHSA